jgi:hypothetical protein
MVAAANDVPGVVLAQAGVAPENAPNPNAVYVNSLQFAFPGGEPFIDDFTLEYPLRCGSRELPTRRHPELGGESPLSEPASPAGAAR